MGTKLRGQPNLICLPSSIKIPEMMLGINRAYFPEFSISKLASASDWPTTLQYSHIIYNEVPSKYKFNSNMSTKFQKIFYVRLLSGDDFTRYNKLYICPTINEVCNQILQRTPWRTFEDFFDCWQMPSYLPVDSGLVSWVAARRSSWPFILWAIFDNYLPHFIRFLLFTSLLKNF